MPTTTKDLALILTERDCVNYQHIIERASLNGYHDFKYDRIPGHPEYGDCTCPKEQLISDLSAFDELADIVQEVIDGRYDEAPDEEDRQVINDWLSKEGSKIKF